MERRGQNSADKQDVKPSDEKLPGVFRLGMVVCFTLTPSGFCVFSVACFA